MAGYPEGIRFDKKQALEEMGRRSMTGPDERLTLHRTKSTP
jgi:hypothetical protein